MYARFHKPQRWQIWVALHGFAPPCYVLRSRCFFAPSTPAPTSCGAPVALGTGRKNRALRAGLPNAMTPNVPNAKGPALGCPLEVPPPPWPTGARLSTTHGVRCRRGGRVSTGGLHRRLLPLPRLRERERSRWQCSGSAPAAAIPIASAASRTWPLLLRARGSKLRGLHRGTARGARRFVPRIRGGVRALRCDVSLLRWAARSPPRLRGAAAVAAAGGRRRRCCRCRRRW